MKTGSVDRKIIKCLIIGAAGVGKTAIKHLLLNKDPPKQRVSTGVMENPIRAVSISLAGKDGDNWIVVNNEVELMTMIADHIKTTSTGTSATLPPQRHIEMSQPKESKHSTAPTRPADIEQHSSSIGNEPEKRDGAIPTVIAAGLLNVLL